MLLGAPMTVKYTAEAGVHVQTRSPKREDEAQCQAVILDFMGYTRINTCESVKLDIPIGRTWTKKTLSSKSIIKELKFIIP
jgi:hypothetical protein